MVRRDLVARKVGRATAWLEEVDEVISRPAAELTKDPKSRDLASFYLLLAIPGMHRLGRALGGR